MGGGAGIVDGGTSAGSGASSIRTIDARATTNTAAAAAASATFSATRRRVGGSGGRRRELDRRVAFAVLAVAGHRLAPGHGGDARDLVPRWPLQTVHVDLDGSTAEDLVDRDRRRLPVERLGEPRELLLEISGHSPPPTPTAGEPTPARNPGAPSTPSPRAPLPPHAACTRNRPPTRPHTAELPTSTPSPAPDPARTSRPATQHPAPARPRGHRVASLRTANVRPTRYR